MCVCLQGPYGQRAGALNGWHVFGARQSQDIVSGPRVIRGLLYARLFCLRSDIKLEISNISL